MARDGGRLALTLLVAACARTHSNTTALPIVPLALPCTADAFDDSTAKRVTLARFLPQGTLDASFGAAGVSVDSHEGSAEQVLVQGDGKMVVVGYVPSASNDRFAARYDQNGSLDTSFGRSGWQLLPHDERCTVYYSALASGDAVQQPDGRIVITQPCASSRGTGTSEEILPIEETDVRRLNADGDFDMAFGHAGLLSTSFLADDLLGLPDGRFLLAGTRDSADDGSQWVVARFHADGTIDRIFGRDGEITLPFQVRRLILQPNGGFAILGVSGRKLNLIRSRSDGWIDASKPEVSTMDLPPAFELWVADLQPDGKLLVAGRWGNPQTNVGDPAVLRYTLDNTLDESFGQYGIATMDIAASFATDTFSEGARALVALPNEIFVGATVFSIGENGKRGVVVWKLLPNGHPDPRFGTNGVAVAPIGTVAELSDLVWLPKTQRLVAAGWSMRCARRHE